MKPVTFVICAAGEGTRLRTPNMNIPKPLLKVNGISMLERSLQSLEIQPQDQVIVISQQSHQLPAHFSHLKFVEWLEITQTTTGQLATFLLAKDLIQNPRVVIFNCDTSFYSSILRTSLNDDSLDGLVACSKASGESWSFCEIDHNDHVINIEEKVRISDWVSIGHYYFKDINQLLVYADLEIARTDVKEHYVAPVYKHYIKAKAKIKIIKVEEFRPFGSPEQLQEFWGMDLDQLEEQQ